MRSFHKKEIQKAGSRNSSYITIYQQIPEQTFSINEIISYSIHRSRFHEKLRSLDEISSDTDSLAERFFNEHFIPLDSPGTKQIASTANGVLPPGIDATNLTRDELDQYGFYAFLLISLRDEDSERSFIQAETNIFKLRLQRRQTSFDVNDLPIELLKQDIIDKFDQYYKDSKFQIPFQYVFHYIDTSRCTLENGFVTLEPKDMISIFTHFYRVYLQKRIQELKRKKVHQTEIFKVMLNMFDESTGAFFTTERTNWNQVSLDDIENLAHRSFPPCMYNMYTKLKTAHKLFYHGRLQLGLFLKGIGLSLNDSLKLWREEFSKFGITLDQFERQYAYNIRYNYGKEGSARDFSPYSCMGMLRMPTPAPGQTHGCPFMQMKKDDCKVLLERMFKDSKKYKGNAAKEICDSLAEKGQKHPQIACTQLFNRLHDHPYEDGGIRHPCEYFSLSEEQFKEEETKK